MGRVAGCSGDDIEVINVSNLLVICLVWVLESERLLKHTSAKLVLYDRIDRPAAKSQGLRGTVGGLVPPLVQPEPGQILQTGQAIVGLHDVRLEKDLAPEQFGMIH